jgi:hypothetical protein
VKRVGAWEYVKFFFENRRKTDIASLVWIDSDVLVPHASLLVAQFFRIL